MVKLTRQQKLEEAAREIRDYPLSWVMSSDGQRGFGEIQRLKTGEWEARVFGKDYLTDRATFPDEAMATAWLVERRDRAEKQ